MAREESKQNFDHIKVETKKTRIVIGDSYTYNMDHFFLNHNYKTGLKNCPHFTITSNGTIYKHFSLKYFSTFLNVAPQSNINIALQNLSILNNINNDFVDIYNKPYNGEVFQRKWKGIEWWIPYTKIQTESLIYLLIDLHEKINFSLETIKETNVFDQKNENIVGVCYRSNFDKKILDPNPSLDTKKIKNTLIHELIL